MADERIVGQLVVPVASAADQKRALENPDPVRGEAGPAEETTPEKPLDINSTLRNNTIRTMKNDSLLGFELLGLIHQQPMSGYDLRKIFASTAWGTFSDSPGAIYPALRRLETCGLVRGTVEESSSLRKRRVFKITPKGLAIFKAWLKKPVTQDDVIRRTADLMVRFAFMDEVVGEERTAHFLGEFAGQMAGYIPSLRQYLESHAGEMTLSSRLAMEWGIEEYESRLRWARTSIALYEQRRRNLK